MTSVQNGSSAGIPRRAVEDLLGGAEALALGPQPLGVGREALVEPDVRPACTRTLSPNHWWASSWTTTLSPPTGREELLRVDRPGLVLEREADAREVVDDRRRRRRTDTARTRPTRKPEDLGLARERALRDDAEVRRHVGGRPDRASRSRSPGCRPAAPGTVQPSSVSPSSSNDVVPSPVDVGDVVDEHAAGLDGASLAYVIETSTSCRRRRARSTFHARGRCSCPSRPTSRRSYPSACSCRRRCRSGSGRGTGAARPALERARLPGSLVVWPFEVGQRRPVVGADRVRLDEHEVPVRLGVARDLNDSVAPPAGTAIVRMRRLYEESAWPEISAACRSSAPRRLEQRRVDRVLEVDAVLL